MQDDVPSRTIFVRAQKSIYLLMENDSLPRFLLTAAGEAVIKQLKRKQNFCSSFLNFVRNSSSRSSSSKVSPAIEKSPQRKVNNPGSPKRGSVSRHSSGKALF